MDSKTKFAEFLARGQHPYNYEKILIDNYKDRILDIITGKNPAPYEIEIQPSAKCNAGCLHCFARNYVRLEDKLTSEEVIDNISEKILSYEKDGRIIERIKLVGSTGDPLMNPLTGYIIGRFAGKRNIRVFSNFINLGLNHKNKKYLEGLSRADAFNFSCDAGTNEVLYAIKPGAGKLKVDIDNMFGTVRKMKMYNPKLDVTVSYVVGDKNYKDILKATKKAHLFGASRIRFRVDMNGFDSGKAKRTEITEYLHAAKFFEDNRFKVNFIHTEEEFLGNKNSFGTLGKCGTCYASNLWTCIGPNGDVYPCGHIVDKTAESYGSLIENAFEEIWESDRRKEVNSKLPGKKCHICAPSSLRANKMIDFLRSIGRKEAVELVECN